MIPSLAAAPARSPRNRTLECVLRPWRAWQQYGVRVGLRVQLATGLAAPRPNRPKRRRRVRAFPRFHPTRVEESSRWATSRESTIVPEWPPGYLDAFEPSPWLLAASEWGGRAVAMEVPYVTGISLVWDECSCQNGCLRSGTRPVHGGFPDIAVVGGIVSRFCQKISRLRLLREFGCRHLIYQMIFGMLSDLRRGIGKFLGYFPGSREFDR
jgi:hypothetical protein